VPDGNYCVSVVADPDNLLRESNDTNNIALRGISLEGNAVADSPQGCAAGQPAGPKRKRRRCRANKHRHGKRHKRCKTKRRKPAVRESGSAFRAASAAAAG
jgi:hypothetical protein